MACVSIEVVNNSPQQPTCEDVYLLGNLNINESVGSKLNIVDS